MKAFYESPQIEIIEATIHSILQENSGELGGDNDDGVMGNAATLSFEDEEEDGGDNDLWSQDLSLNWDLWK